MAAHNVKEINILDKLVGLEPPVPSFSGCTYIALILTRNLQSEDACHKSLLIDQIMTNPIQCDMLSTFLYVEFLMKDIVVLCQEIS